MSDSVIHRTALASGIVFQEEGLSMNWQLTQDSSMVERQAIDLEVRGSSPGSG